MSSLAYMIDQADRMNRIQPYIARMGQCVGFYWFQITVEARSAVMEMVDGSAGLDDKLVEWAKEFDDMWEERCAIVNPTDLSGGGDFMSQIINFADTKIKSLVAEARLSQ